MADKPRAEMKRKMAKVFSVTSTGAPSAAMRSGGLLTRRHGSQLDTAWHQKTLFGPN